MTSPSIWATNGTCRSNLVPESQAHLITSTQVNLTRLVEKTTVGKSPQREPRLMGRITSSTPAAVIPTKSMK